MQGRLPDGNDFLVTLPVDLWSTCELTCTPIRGPLIVECALEKSRAVVSQVLEELGFTRGCHVSVEFWRNIPIGKGMSSSTADMLAALRALQEVFGFLYRESFLSRVFANIEPHDALFYNGCVVYNHRKGLLLRDYSYIPDYYIIAVDRGGTVDTMEYNRGLAFAAERCTRFESILQRLDDAFARRDDEAIAMCASFSTGMHAEATASRFLWGVAERWREYGAMGVVATHSGTCAGYLFPGDIEEERAESLAARIREDFGLEVFRTRTLSLLQ